MSNKLGEIIQLYREKAGWTQDELGQKVGVSQQTIAKWESGKSNPRPKVLERVVGTLRFDANHIKQLLPSTRIEAWADSFPTRMAEALLEETEVSDDANVETPLNQLDMFPSTSRFSMAGIGAGKTLKKLIAPVIDKIEPSSQWDVLLQSPFGNVRVDYANDELHAIFLHADGPASLTLLLRGSIFRHLWRYMTLSGAGQLDSHYQLLIITLPDGESIDLEPKSVQHMRAPVSNQKLLQRLTSEALSIGIYIVLARTPKDVVRILTNPSKIHDPGWDWPGRQWEENPET